MRSEQGQATWGVFLKFDKVKESEVVLVESKKEGNASWLAGRD